METTRRDILKAAGAAAANPVQAQSRKSRPHILLLKADPFRGDCLGSDGNRTPNLDRLDAAGAPAHPQLGGRSLLPLLSGKTEGWREYLDLEHGVCYSPQNHWNAWRGRVIAHLAPRGDAFVKNGKLIPGPQDMPALPNFPDRRG